VRRVDPAAEAAFLVGPFSSRAREVKGRLAVAPPGVALLVRIPRTVRDHPLPDADRARIRSRDGSLFGFEGTVSVSVAAQGSDLLRAAVEAGARSVDDLIVAAVRESGVAVDVPGARLAGVVPMRRELRRRLESAFETRGLVLDALDLGRRVFLLDAEPERRPVAESRVFVLGLDGADWSILEPLLDAGRMPNLRSLLDRGVRAKLQSISPMISPVVWTTVATGLPPERHGILDFLTPAGRPGEGEPVTSAERRVPAVWEILSDRGISCGVVGWWATWPAEPIRGYMISDRVAYQLFGFRPDTGIREGKIWPADLYDALAGRIVEPATVAWEEVVPYLDGPRRREEEFDETERALLDDFRTLLASGRTYLAMAQEARRRFDPRFEAVYFEGTDTVGHLFMPYRDPPLDGVDPERRRSFRSIVDRYYETIDGYLGELLRDRGPEWTVLVVSDHGFATDEGRPRTTDSRIGHGPAADWHRRFGVLVMSGARVRPGAKMEEASVNDVAPTLLALHGLSVPRSWTGRVLAEALAPEFLEDHPVLFREEEFSKELAPYGDVAETLTHSDADALRQKLQSLGYIAPTSESGSSGASGENNRGVAFLAAGRYDAAEEAFRAALRQSPGQPMVTVNLALALRFQGKTDEAVALFERSLVSPAARRTAGLQLAQIAMERGDLARAETILRGVLSSEPGAGEIRNSLGLVLERSGRPVEAAEAYREAARLDPDVAEPRNNLGNLARRAGRPEEAERHFLDAIEADPFFLGAYNNLALLYQDRGDLSRAIELYGRALEKAPENAVVLNNLGSLYFATGEVVEARSLWEEAARLDPAYASPRNNLAGIALTEGRVEDAETLLREALEIDPGYGDARINLALAAQGRGEIERARADLLRALDDPRAEGTAALALAALELGEGNDVAAVNLAERAVTLRPSDAEAWTVLGEGYRRLGRMRDARRAWSRALEIRPANDALRAAFDGLPAPPPKNAR
jgi:Flp pilus assembly protein TadD/predicted AlkP superfamily phosphohydrolase/phosphomutase